MNGIGTPSGFVRVTVTKSVAASLPNDFVTPTSGRFAGLSSRRVDISVKGGDVMFLCIEGLYPTSSEGQPAVNGSIIRLESRHEAINFKAIAIACNVDLLATSYH
jgi:hypothetical protein